MHPLRLALVVVIVMFTVAVALTLRPSDDQQQADQTVQQFTIVKDHVADRALQAGVPPEPSVDHVHEHAAVRLLVDGVLVSVPDGLGVNADDGTFSAIHTHDSSSVVHLHRPHGADPFTLRQLFAVWGVRAEGHTLVGRGDLSMTVNGSAIPYTLDHPFVDRDDIVIVIGNKPNKSLGAFSWQSAPVQ